MTWFKVDDTLHSHKKAMRAGTEAMGLWVLAGSWAADQLTDGWVPEYAILRWSSNPHEVAAKLVSAGLWVPGEFDGDSGWWFHGWRDWQPTREEVTARRKADADRRARWREEQKRRREAALSHPASHRDPSHRDAPCDSPGDAGPDDPRDAPEVLFSNEDAEASRRDAPRESRQGSALPDPTRPDPLPTEEKKLGRSSRRRPSGPLPESWCPNGNHAHFATEHDLDLAFEADQFRAHAEANDRRLAGWDAGFRQWLGVSSRTHRPPRPGRSSSPSNQNIVDIQNLKRRFEKPPPSEELWQPRQLPGGTA
jgi:hypothetical protein